VCSLRRFDRADDLHRRNQAWLAEECDLVLDVAALVPGLS
jgi:hypothetical protein